MIATLSIFDFDGTLFNTPIHPPNGWEGYWWGSPDSIGPPCVPYNPGSPWWNDDVVRKARIDIKDKNTLTVVITGRPNDIASTRYRVAELFKLKELDFDHIFFHDNKMGNAVPFMKALRTVELLQDLPHVNTVRIYEDNKENIDIIGKVCRMLKVECEAHFINRKSIPCGNYPIVS